jgi:hypothetical protein
MKANELRIGNLVTDSIGIVEIGKNGKIDWGDIYNPIPITENILLKCGFDKINEVLFWLNNTFMFVLNENALSMARPDSVDDEDYSIPMAWIKSNINYLHQLQNLYFALTENELNVTL